MDLPTTTSKPVLDSKFNSLLIEEEGSQNVITNDSNTSYVPFEDSFLKPKQVDKQIFLPLYVLTACVILFTHFLPTALVVFLVSLWAITFVATPLYYLYHYNPLGDSDPCAFCRDVSTTTETTTPATTTMEPCKPPTVEGAGRTASV